MEGELRTWVLAQRAAKKGKRGCLTEAQIQRLEGIGMVWEPLTDQWQEMYQHAKAVLSGPSDAQCSLQL